MRKRLHILPDGERGFTLMESLLVVGLTTLITVGIVAGLIEGMDTLQEMTDARSVDAAHQRAMAAFTKDVQAATWFHNPDPVHDDTGALVLSKSPQPFSLVLGYPGPDGREVWVRYATRVGPFTGETYLMRTVLVSVGSVLLVPECGSTIITTGVANLLFDYFDAEGKAVSELPEVSQIRMLLSVNVGGATLQREYDASMRNPNYGVKQPPGDFGEIESDYLPK